MQTAFIPNAKMLNVMTRKTQNKNHTQILFFTHEIDENQKVQ